MKICPNFNLQLEICITFNVNSKHCFLLSAMSMKITSLDRLFSQIFECLDFIELTSDSRCQKKRMVLITKNARCLWGVYFFHKVSDR